VGARPLAGSEPGLSARHPDQQELPAFALEREVGLTWDEADLTRRLLNPLGHTDRWPGTLSLHPTTMISVVAELGRWAHASGFRKFVIVNGHATNGPPCQSAILQLRHELPPSGRASSPSST
jgi:Creatinine amidohydrolase